MGLLADVPPGQRHWKCLLIQVTAAYAPSPGLQPVIGGLGFPHPRPLLFFTTSLMESSMPAATHTKAAEQHEATAKAHKAAAELHGKGNHSAAVEKSKEAHGSGEAAQKVSTEAHGKSTAHAKK